MLFWEILSLILLSRTVLSIIPLYWREKMVQEKQRYLKRYRLFLTLDRSNHLSISVIWLMEYHKYVLRSALEDRDNVLIITLSNDHGTIHSKNITAPTILPTITSAETNYLAFGILSVDYHIELYGYLQNKTGNYTVKKCDDYIAAQTAFYNPALHAKASSFTDQRGQTRNYQTLSTYIRNLIDHPDPNRNYTQEELKCSTELLIELCR